MMFGRVKLAGKVAAESPTASRGEASLTLGMTPNKYLPKKATVKMTFFTAF